MSHKDPTTIPQWPVGFFASKNPWEEIPEGLSEVERRIVKCLVHAYRRMTQEDDEEYRQGLLHECRGMNEALQSLYAPPWRGEHPSMNEGATMVGWSLQLDWQSRLY